MLIHPPYKKSIYLSINRPILSIGTNVDRFYDEISASVATDAP